MLLHDVHNDCSQGTEGGAGASVPTVWRVREGLMEGGEMAFGWVPRG